MSGTTSVAKKVDLADHINAELQRVGAKVANLMTLAALDDPAPPVACEETALDASILDILCDAPLFGEDCDVLLLLGAESDSLTTTMLASVDWPTTEFNISI